MFELYCHRCDRSHLVGTRSIESFHNTSDGPVAYVRCPRGHVLARAFRDDRPATGPTVPTVPTGPTGPTEWKVA